MASFNLQQMHHFYTQGRFRAFVTGIKSYLTLLLLICLFSVNAFTQAVSPGTAPVTPPTTGFGIDGDLKANVPTAGVGDWLPNTAASGGVLSATGQAPAGSTTTFHRTDSYSNGDNIFSGGLKKDGNLNAYTWKNGSPSPAKCDINNLLVHIADDATGDTWITLSGDRQSVNGNSFISIALLQKLLTRNNDFTFTSGAPSSTGGRTLGDVQVSAEFTGGGTNPNLYLEEWRNVGGVYKWVSFSIPAGKTFAYGKTNAATLTGVPYDAFGGSSYQINAFIEVSFNISEIYRNTATACVGSITSMFVMTKSSQSVTADLADFVDPIEINLDINSPKPTATGATYCVGNTIQNLTVTGESGATFNWYTAVDADGKPTGTPTTGASYATGINNAVSGTYDFYVTQSIKGCESEPTKVTVVVNPNATANAGTAPTAQCLDATNGNTFSLSGSGSNGTPSWSVQSKSPSTLTAVITNGNTFTPSVKVTGGTGTVTLRLTVTSPYTPSCGTPTSDVTVTVNPNATASAGDAPTAQCLDDVNGNTFNLSGSGTNGNPVWTVQSKSPSTLTAVITNGTTFTPSVKVTGGSGTVTLRLTVNSNTTPSCGNPTSDVTVTVNPLPTASAGTDPAAQCYVASGNTFNLTGTGTNGNPSWAVQSKPAGSTVTITGGATLTPSVKIVGSSTGGTVTLRLTVTSNTTPACGSATDDVDLKITAQVDGPNAVMLPVICTDQTFKVQVNSPVSGTKYTATQPLNGNTYSSEINYTGTGDVIFTGLKFGDGYSVIAAKDGCVSAPSDCGVVHLTSTTKTQVAQPVVTEEISGTKATVAPNPFNDRIRFSLTPGVSGRGTLELYNFMGQKVKTVFEGSMQKGQVKTIEYYVPNAQRTNLIYMFRVGNERTSGKLIGLK